MEGVLREIIPDSPLNIVATVAEHMVITRNYYQVEVAICLDHAVNESVCVMDGAVDIQLSMHDQEFASDLVGQFYR